MTGFLPCVETTETELFLVWWETTTTAQRPVNANARPFVKAARPINQLRSVRISLCVEANIHRLGRGETINVACHFLSPSSSHRINLCQHRLHHFFFMLQFVLWLFSLSLTQILLSLPPSILSLSLHLHILSTPLPLFIPPFPLVVVAPPLLCRSLRTAVFTLRLVLLQRRTETCLAAVV